MKLHEALLAEIRDHLETLLVHPLKMARENANGLLACPFRLADTNAKCDDSETNGYDCGQ